MDKIKIAIIDDHNILRQGLRRMLEDMNNIEIILEASDGDEFVNKLEDTKPDIAIVDIKMQKMNGDEAVRIAKQKMPELKIIILSMLSGEEYYNIFNQLGVDGYLLKDSEYDDLYKAINTVQKGGKFFSQELLLSLLKDRLPESNIKFTKREKDILKHLCLGLSTQEIADKLFLSNRTIEKYRSDLLLKTGATNSISLVLFAIKNRIVKIEN